MFESLGLGSAAETSYLQLVRHGPATVIELAAQLHRPPPAVAEAVEELRQLGLLCTTTHPDDPIVAVPLAMGLDHLIQQRQHELERLRHSTEQLVSQIHTHAGQHDQVRIITGREDVVRHVHRLQATARQQLRMLIRSPDGATALLHDTLNQYGSRGLTYQLVYDECGINNADGLSGLCARLGDLAQTRMAAQLPVRLTLVDSTAALLPLDLDNAAAEQAVLVRPGALLDALDALFTSVWRLATPLALTNNSRSGDALDEQDHALLSLLVGGFTDDAAGARLGMSRRTVARRVQRLMNVTGARSRLQLGWWARERRWL